MDALDHIFLFKKWGQKNVSQKFKNWLIQSIPKSKATVILALVIHFFTHFGSVMRREILVWNSGVTGLKDSSASNSASKVFYEYCNSAGKVFYEYCNSASKKLYWHSSTSATGVPRHWWSFQTSDVTDSDWNSSAKRQLTRFRNALKILTVHGIPGDCEIW